ncbi:MAG: RuBisCO accumulation factor 1 [Elainellaceae cyanobacterium]
MSAIPPSNSDASAPSTPMSDDEVLALLKSLRRKEGTWVDWGTACQRLQKEGYNAQQIFEETGFEPIQQNQIIVAVQVYGAIATGDNIDAAQGYFSQRGSDILYEFRILNQPGRRAAAKITMERGLDADAAHELAKAVRDYTRLTTTPHNFAPLEQHPGDAVAYYYWKLARQQSDLQARSRLIAQGLSFAETASARSAIEKLLTDFTVIKSRTAPLMPMYRLDSEEELPRIIPVAGKLPLDVDAFKAVPLLEDEAPFRIVKFSGTGAWVPLPGWKAVLAAEDPIVVLAQTHQLPLPPTGTTENVLILVDRAQRQWNADSYFLVDADATLQVQWTEEESQEPILGRVAFILKARQVLDEESIKDLWQFEE